MSGNNEHLFLTIPNIFTLSNLIFGVISITLSLLGLYLYAFLSIFLAILCDGLDGFVARKLNAANDFGKELDSLCDQVSFGVAPTVLLLRYTMESFPQYTLYAIFVGAVFTAFGALRLARFNIFPSKEFFEGLAIPAGAFYAGLSVLTVGQLKIELTLILYFVIAVLMISSVIYPSAKTRFGVTAIGYTIVIGFALGIIFVFLLEISEIIEMILWILFFVITTYAFISPIIFRFTKQNRKKD